MFEKVVEAIHLLKAAVAELDPDVLEGTQAAKLVEVFAEAERLGAAGKGLAARRVADSGAWRASGERSAAHWMAAATGTSVGSAVGLLETAARLGELPGTDAAVRTGALSEAQTKEVAAAAAADPAAEKELLECADRDSLTALRERAAKVRAAAVSDEAERYELVHKRRWLRHWSDPDGAFRLDARLTPDAGTAVLAALEPSRERLLAEARAAGRREPHEAYAADALVAVAGHVRDCDTEPERTGPGALVHVLVDHKALTRGHVEGAESCEIAGVGPIPAATARALASDSILSVLVTDGTDIKTVSHPGRTIPARLRTALLARDRKCVVPGM
ncbi:MAG: 13E12 repeat family protein [Actinomycetota bacterium]|nr:13E12 repeat family protein [Actinomycetota bacterium]